MRKLNISIEDDPPPQDLSLLRQQLYEFNVSRTGLDGQFISVFLRDRRRQVMGGLHGWTAFNYLHVDVLWIREDVRGQGYGKRLLLACEGEAVARGCRYAELETFSFQALEFYRKLGYAVFGELEGLAGGHRWYFLKKELV